MLLLLLQVCSALFLPLYKSVVITTRFLDGFWHLPLVELICWRKFVFLFIFVKLVIESLTLWIIILISSERESSAVPECSLYRKPRVPQEWVSLNHIMLYITSLMYIFTWTDVAKQLDEGKGLKTTVESVKDANKRGALHFAAREGQTEICRYLLEELKLDADTKDEAGSFVSFCFFIALLSFTLNLVMWDCEDVVSGDTPLVHAARQGQVGTAKYLLDHGADPNIASELGATALHHAAGTGWLLINMLCFLRFRSPSVVFCSVF